MYLRKQIMSGEEKLIKKLLGYFKKIEIPERVKNYDGKILLHIGDVPIWGYPYIKRLVKKIKPHILVHTGDLADDCKAGRIAEHIPAYKKAVPSLIKTMEKYADEVYIVPGNNDLKDFIKENITKSKFVEPNTVVDIYGIKCLLCHRVIDIDGEAEFYLYGHGPTGDTHSFYTPENGKVFSNVFYSPAVIFIEDKTYMELKNYNGGLHK